MVDNHVSSTSVGRRKENMVEKSCQFNIEMAGRKVK